MANFVFANNIKTTVASAFSNVATSLTLASSVGLPTLSAGQVLPITINDAATGLVYEICYATAITGATLTVTRAQEGTAAQNWLVGDRAYCAPTALSVAPVNGNGLNVFQVANAVASNEAVNLGQAQADFLAIGGNAVSATNATNVVGYGTISNTTTGGAALTSVGRFLGFTTITVTNSAWVPNALTTKFIVEVWGGGGAGGSGTALNGGGLGEQGHCGNKSYGLCTSVSGTYNITIGAGGVGAGSNTGGTGGTSSITGTGISVYSLGGLGGRVNLVETNGTSYGAIGETGVGHGGTNDGGSAAANSAAGGGSIWISGAAGGNGGSGIVFIWEYA